MAWLSVHQSIAGHKLRGLSKGLGCSECEAMGILLKLWLWALDNADKSGELLNADSTDVSRVYIGSTAIKLKPERIVEILTSEGWIDYVEDRLFIHDWTEWQKYWFDYQERREKDRTRKRRGNSGEKEEEYPQIFRGISAENSTEIPQQTKTIPKQKQNNTESNLYHGHDKADTMLSATKNSDDVVDEIIAFLNLTIGANYKATGKKSRELINARLHEGFSLSDFRAVILKKNTEWGSDTKMSAYLRPETLFGTKFESYLNQPAPAPKSQFLDIARREGSSL